MGAGTRRRFLIATGALILALGCLSAAPRLHAELYRWVDEKGVTHYSETPPPGRKAGKVQAQPVPEGAKPASKDWQDQEREFQRRRIGREEAEDKRQADEKQKRIYAAARKANCIQAQQNLHALQSAVPVYAINEKGERVFVEDSARPVAIEAAKKNVEMYCKAE